VRSFPSPRTMKPRNSTWSTKAPSPKPPSPKPPGFVSSRSRFPTAKFQHQPGRRFHCWRTLQPRLGKAKTSPFIAAKALGVRAWSQPACRSCPEPALRKQSRWLAPPVDWRCQRLPRSSNGSSTYRPTNWSRLDEAAETRITLRERSRPHRSNLLGRLIWRRLPNDRAIRRNEGAR